MSTSKKDQKDQKQNNENSVENSYGKDQNYDNDMRARNERNDSWEREDRQMRNERNDKWDREDRQARNERNDRWDREDRQTRNDNNDRWERENRSNNYQMSQLDNDTQGKTQNQPTDQTQKSQERPSS
ncbi:hypothetical protein [Brumimicrobium mesophilum]|uniref:hypothetical protein n=1 Tax=Brumimicrobium mesophilum TaxID=392717 RepID=UPI000D14051D|nr:hypothetical protein [Brumimicrobium mesophilum]